MTRIETMPFVAILRQSSARCSDSDSSSVTPEEAVTHQSGDSVNAALVRKLSDSTVSRTQRIHRVPCRKVTALEAAFEATLHGSHKSRSSEFKTQKATILDDVLSEIIEI